MNAIRRHPIVSALILAGVIFVCCVGSFVAYVVVSTLGAVGGLPDAPLLATVRPTDAPTAAPTDEPTGGLGATRAWWEREHRLTGEESLWQIFDDKRYLVIFIDDRAQDIEKRFGQGVTLVESDVERQAAELLPADAVFVEAYQPDAVNTPETHVMVYTSAWLAGVFDEAQWYGADPGTFIVLYRIYDGGVTNLIVSTGNNP